MIPVPGGTGAPGERGEALGGSSAHCPGARRHGRVEDLPGVHRIVSATVAAGEPEVRETDGTTDAAAWVLLADVDSGSVPVVEVVTAALAMGAGR